MRIFDLYKQQSFSGKMGGVTMKRKKVFWIMMVLLLPTVLAAPTPSTKTLKNPNKYKKYLDKTRRKIETTVDYSTDILSSTVTTFTTQLVQNNDNSKNSPPASLDNSNDNDVTTIQSEASSTVIIRNETGMDFSSLNIQQTLSSNGPIKTNEEFTVTTVSNKLITTDSHDKIKHSGVDGITNSPLDSEFLRSDVEKPQLNEDLTVEAHEPVIKQSTDGNIAIEKPEMKHNDNLKLMENERDFVISSESFSSPTSTLVTKMPSNLENKKLKTKDSKKKYSKVQNTKKMKVGKKIYGNNDAIDNINTSFNKKLNTVTAELLENPANLDDVLTTVGTPNTTPNVVATTHESIVSTTMEPKISTQDTTQDITLSSATAPNIYLDIILYKGDEPENLGESEKEAAAVLIEEMFPATTTTTTTAQSTSIKPAPTTIKPTTLIHSKNVFDSAVTDIPEHKLSKSNQGKSDIIELRTTTVSSIETTPSSLQQSTENLVENVETTIATTVNTITMDSLSTLKFNGSESATKIDEVGDKIIILNANNTNSNEGVIVIDILEQVGSFNSVNNNHSDDEGFIINMDLIDNTTEDSAQKNDDDKLEVIIERPNNNNNNNGEPSSTKKDDIVLTTEFDITSITQAPVLSSTVSVKTTTKNDDIILINDNADPTIDSKIVWNEVKNPTKEDIKIVFDQQANLTLSNGELVIDNIYINNANSSDTKSDKADSLEIILVEDDSMLNENFQAKTTATPTEDDSFSPLPSITTFSPKEITTRINENGKEMQNNNFPTTIQIELPSNKHVLNSGSKVDESDEDEIKIKTTNKDSDTIFYISNTEVKVIENVPTKNPNQAKDKQNFPAIYEEDVIVDFSEKNRSAFVIPDKYEEDIVLSPLTSDFDPLKDINYIGEAFLDVEETQNGEPTENHHIIPLTSDVVIQPMKDTPVGMPIIGEPPQIELEEMVFNDDYDFKHDQTSSFKVEEFYPQFYGNQLTKSHLTADIPHDLTATLKNETSAKNKTLLNPSANINGTNTTNSTSSFTNGTAFLVEAEADNEDLNDVQTLFLACMATLTPLFLSVIVAFTVRHFWKRYQRRSAMSNDLISDKSTDPLAEKSKSADELKSTESGLSSNRNCDTVESSTELLTAAEPTSITNNHAGTNGSIFTMTLKNNHLIVETEERDDLSCDTRETKMHYSPSEKDGVFIVEAARGANQNGSYTSPSSVKPHQTIETINETTNGEIKIDSLQNNYAPSSSEEEEQQQKSQVQVHSPPAEVVEDPPKENPICNGTKTGLSQSDLSLTSSNSSNQGYTYGNHEPYQYEDKGYKGSSPKRVINIHCHNDLKPLIENSPPIDDPDKPKITAAIYKEDTINNNYEHENENGVTETEQDNEPEQKIVQNHKILNGDVPHLSENDIIDAVPAKFDSIVTPVMNGEVTLDSLSLLPPPPLAVDEISEQTILNLDTMDSLPPPPPNEIIASSES